MERSLKSKLVTTFFLVFSIFAILFLITEIEPLWKKVVFVVFSLYTIPFMKLRYEFRSIVYETDDWKINIKPVFFKEIQVLFSIKSLESQFDKVVMKYRLYLIGYLLFVLIFLI